MHVPTNFRIFKKLPKKLVSIFKPFIFLFLLIVVLQIILMVSLEVGCKSESDQINSTQQYLDSISRYNDTAYLRDEVQSYITFTEWYIVYSSVEYANFLETNRPSQFPYLPALKQYWTSDCKIHSLTSNSYPTNWEYRISSYVIGWSFTLENLSKFFYESSIGRLTENIAGETLTAEEIYANNVAKDYAMFLHTIPWYKYDFNNKIVGLWKVENRVGENLIRKWERRLSLTFEYSVKSAFGMLLKFLSESAYGLDELTLYAVMKGSDKEFLLQNNIEVIKELEPQVYLVKIERYEAFTQNVSKLADTDFQFIHIAGNDEILVSVISPISKRDNYNQASKLFTLSVLTNPSYNREILNVQVKDLVSFISELKNSNTKLEHIYDY